MASWWNCTCLQPPPFLVYPCENNHVGKELAEITEKGMKLMGLDKLKDEMVILNRLVFKIHMKFKRFKQYQAIRRFAKCMDRFLHVDLDKSWRMLLQALPRDIDDDALTLPSKQMAQFVLTKIFGCIHLLKLACEHCFSSIEFTIKELELGFFVHMNMVLSSCLSRLWVLSASLLFQLKNIYEQIYDLLRLLKAAPVEWIPEGETLPNRLDEIIMEGSLKKIRDIARNENEQELSSALDLEKSQQTNIDDIVNTQMEDIGTLIPRSMYEAEKVKNVSICSVKKDLNKLTNKKQILRWLKEENDKVLQGEASSVSCMKKCDWKVLRKCIKQVFNTNEKSDFIIKWVKRKIIKWFKNPEESSKMFRNNEINFEINVN